LAISRLDPRLVGSHWAGHGPAHDGATVAALCEHRRKLEEIARSNLNLLNLLGQCLATLFWALVLLHPI
jgi:hypothetical protein